MSAFNRYFILVSALSLVGLASLILGFIINKRRPVLISPEVIWGALSFMLLPALGLAVFKLISNGLERDSTLLVLLIWSAVMPIAMIGYVPLMVLTWYYLLFNVTETMIVEGLNAALQMRKVDYVWKREGGFLTKLLGLSERTVSLAGAKHPIKVILISRGRAWVRFRGIRRLHDYKTLIFDFRRALSEKVYDGPTGAVSFFAMSAVCVLLIVTSTLLHFF